MNHLYHKGKNFFTQKINQTRTCLMIPALFLLQNPTKAIERTAIANQGNGWNVSSNWSPAGVPQSGDIAIIPAGFTLTVKNGVYNSPLPALTIKIYGTLDFDPSGKIELSSPSNLSVYSGGRIISNGTSSELIKIGGVIKFSGQLDGTIIGPRFANSSTGASPAGFLEGVLAIKLVSFRHTLINGTVKLEWVASSDHPEDKFKIQRNVGTAWEDLGTLFVTGNPGENQSYGFTDYHPSGGINLYRLKLMNADKAEQYSKIISVAYSTKEREATVFPNPAKNQVTLSWKQTDKSVRIYVMNAVMNCVTRKEITDGSTSVQVDISNMLPGIYLVRITNGSDLNEYLKLVVN